eukprot:2204304-Lingulodinium_polyedra.AAC.1
MARVGLGDLLRSVQAPDALVGSSFAEINDELAGAVQRAWNTWAEAGGGCPHGRVAKDVWGLLRNGARPLRG